MKLFRKKKKEEVVKQEVAVSKKQNPAAAVKERPSPPQQQQQRPPLPQRPQLPPKQRPPPPVMPPKAPSVRVKEAPPPQATEPLAMAPPSPVPEAELKTPPPQDQGVRNTTSNISSSYNTNSQSPSLEEDAQRNAVTRELVKKFVADIWNRGDLDLIPEVCSKSLRFNGSVGMDRVGHDGFARMVTTIRDALNDYHCEIHSMVVEGGKAFCRMRFTGRHTGSLLGFPPTGRQVAWMGAAEFTCKDSKIIKVWELGDVKSLEDQLSGN